MPGCAAASKNHAGCAVRVRTVYGSTAGLCKCRAAAGTDKSIKSVLTVHCARASRCWPARHDSQSVRLSPSNAQSSTGTAARLCKCRPAAATDKVSGTSTDGALCTSQQVLAGQARQTVSQNQSDSAQSQSVNRTRGQTGPRQSTLGRACPSADLTRPAAGWNASADMNLGTYSIPRYSGRL